MCSLAEGHLGDHCAEQNAVERSQEKFLSQRLPGRGDKYPRDPRHVHSYREGLGIADKLAKSASGNADWQRDLEISFNRIGDVQKAQDNLSGALKSYRDGLAISDRLAKSASGNPGWQRDLALSFELIGDVQKAQGDRPAAVKSYRHGLDIADKLTKSDPSNAEWQRDLATLSAKLAASR
jgi:tetratricopeptide (TPR) repeat protein